MKGEGVGEEKNNQELTDTQHAAQENEKILPVINLGALLVLPHLPRAWHHDPSGLTGSSGDASLAI